MFDENNDGDEHKRKCDDTPTNEPKKERTKNAEYQRALRRRKRGPKSPPKTDAERAKAYRERKKQKNLLNSQLPSTSGAENVVFLLINNSQLGEGSDDGKIHVAPLTPGSADANVVQAEVYCQGKPQHIALTPGVLLALQPQTSPKDVNITARTNLTQQMSHAENGISRGDNRMTAADPAAEIADAKTITESNTQSQIIQIKAEYETPVNLNEKCPSDEKKVDSAAEFKVKTEAIDLECDCIKHNSIKSENLDNSMEYYQNCIGDSVNFQSAVGEWENGDKSVDYQNCIELSVGESNGQTGVSSIKAETISIDNVRIKEELCDNDAEFVDCGAPPDFNLKTEDIDSGYDCIGHSLDSHGKKCENGMRIVQYNCAQSKELSCPVSNHPSVVLNTQTDKVRTQCVTVDDEAGNSVRCAGEFVLKTEEIDLGCDGIEHPVKLSSHSDDHTCKVREKNFTGGSNLKNHMLIHTLKKSHKFTREKPHKCSICEKKFIQKRNLDRHILTHNGENPHKCSICEKKFTKKWSLYCHILTHTGEKNHKCSVCEKNFAQKSTLNKHMLTHTGEKSHICSVCKKNFSQKGNLNKHMLTHMRENSHICRVCEKKFVDNFNLTEHMLTHTGENPYQCSVCAKKFTQKSSLNRHMLLHTGEKPHKCNVCKRKFSFKENLKQHMKTHNGHQSLECEVCKKKCSRISTLNRHMATHT